MIIEKDVYGFILLELERGITLEDITITRNVKRYHTLNESDYKLSSSPTASWSVTLPKSITDKVYCSPITREYVGGYSSAGRVGLTKSKRWNKALDEAFASMEADTDAFILDEVKRAINACIKRENDKVEGNMVDYFSKLGNYSFCPEDGVDEDGVCELEEIVQKKRDELSKVKEELRLKKLDVVIKETKDFINGKDEGKNTEKLSKDVLRKILANLESAKGNKPSSFPFV